MKKNLLSFVLFSILIQYSFVTVQATIIDVPSQHATIQAALNSAVTGDTVLVQPGSYLENITWPLINGIVLLSAGDSSNTIIDGNAAGRVIHFPTGTNADATTIIKGFTITNGLLTSSWYGAGIYLQSASPLITEVAITGNKVTDTRAYGAGVSTSNSNAIFRNVSITNNMAQTNNSYSFGGGMYCKESNITLENSVISDNILDTNGRSYGAGMYLDTSHVIMRNVSITNNKAYGTSFSLGGGLYITNSSPVLTNVLIASNYLYKPSGSPTGGGIYVGGTSTLNIMNSTIADNYASTASINGSGIYNSATVNLTNTILWNEHGSSSELSGSGTTNATYSDVRGGLTGTGNVDLLPNFVSASNYDLLASSPCIDAGTTAGAPADDIEGTLRDANPDIGAYEGPLATNLPTTNENSSAITIYPNPITDFVKISVTADMILTYSIYDVTGKQVFSESGLNLQELVLPRSVFQAPGLFIINITTDSGKNYTKKLIVQNIN